MVPGNEKVAVMNEGKFFWLKLHRNFFKRHDIRIIEDMENGKDYVLFYMKLLLESVDHDGHLRFSNTIPYNEKMLSTITNTNIDIVRSAIKIFIELGMMDVLDDGTIYMSETKKMLGNETKWAKYKRDERAKIGHCPNVSKKSPIEKETELETELEKDNIINTNVLIVGNDVANCPHSEIINLYKLHCPSAIHPKSWSGTRANNLKARWREDKNRQNLEWWGRFFEYISKSDFLMGKTHSRDRSPFELRLDWIVNSSNFNKIIDGVYDNK